MIVCLEIEAEIQRGSCKACKESHPVVVTLGPVRVVVILGLNNFIWHVVITAAAPSRLCELWQQFEVGFFVESLAEHQPEVALMVGSLGLYLNVQELHHMLEEMMD